MTAAEEPDLVARLVAQPRDHEALRALYASFGDRPERYAALLEQAAESCAEKSASSHYLTEAGRASLEALSDVPEACRLLARAVELDPLNVRAANLLGHTVSTQLRRSDYGGLLRRRAGVLDRMAATAKDLTLVWAASDAWEQVAALLVKTDGSTEEAMDAMTRALDVVRRTFRSSGAPGAPDAPFSSDEAPASSPWEGGRRDTIRTPKPASAMVSRPSSSQGEASDAAPTRPRQPPREMPQATLPVDEGDRMTETDLGAEAMGGGATIPSPRPPEGPLPTDAPAPPSSTSRLMGLFESLPDVAAEPTLEGAARYVADLVRRKLAARAALVHVFDPIGGEYVLTAASGAYDRALIGTRIPASDPELLRALMTAGSIIVDAGPRGNLETSRWVSLQPKRCVLVAPACIDGQAYGAIELCDPLDRGRFDTEDEHALTYVGERWAELIAEREPH